MSAWLQTVLTLLPYRPDPRLRADGPEVDESPRSRPREPVGGNYKLPLAPNATRAQRNDRDPRCSGRKQTPASARAHASRPDWVVGGGSRSSDRSAFQPV